MKGKCVLINNLHKNVRDNCSFNLRVYIANIPLAKISWQPSPCRSEASARKNVDVVRDQARIQPKTLTVAHSETAHN